MKNIRVGLRPFQYAVSSTRLCILQDIVGVGEKLGLKLVRVLLRRCDRTGEFVIQKQSAAAGDVGSDGVEYFSAGLVFIKTVIDKVARNPPLCERPQP